jgi:hypothetical protein
MRRAFITIAIVALAVWLAVEVGEGRAPITTPTLRHLRAMKDRRDAPAAFEDLSFAEIAALPAHPPAILRDALEGRGARVEGYVQHAGHSFDGDIHLTLVERPEGASRGRGTRYLTVEVTPAWSRGSNWTPERIANALSAERTSRPPRVRISGWLMHDWWADALPSAMFDRAHRISAWEIHPVTRIEYWDEAKKAMVDLPR